MTGVGPCGQCWVARRIEPYLRELGEVRGSVLYAASNRDRLTERAGVRFAEDLLRIQDLATDAAASLRAADDSPGGRWAWEARAFLLVLARLALDAQTASLFRNGTPEHGQRVLEVLEAVLAIQAAHEDPVPTAGPLM